MLSNKDRTQENEGRTRHGDGLWNVLTVLTLLGLLALVGAFASILIDPNSTLNPFPPATLPPTIVLPSETPTPRLLPATWTPTVTWTPVPTRTPSPPPTLTPTPVTPTATPDPKQLTATHSAYAYIPRAAPTALSAELYAPDRGCGWLGVAGQALDQDGAPVVGITVQLAGYLVDRRVDQLSLTGTALQYGPGGYEFTLSDLPVDSKKAVSVQLLDQAGLALSDRIYFDTYADCERNLILLNFRRVK